MNKAHLPMLLLLAGSLAACNSTESALNVQGSKQTTEAAATPTTEQTAQTGTTQPVTGQAATGTPSAVTIKPAATANKSVKLHIAPIVGAPVNIVTPLTHRMNDDSRARKIELAGNNDPAATHMMKGYFSVLAENNQTTVLYVWDVLDASGNRLHRIQGQEKVAGAAADSWSVVTPATMETIADRTIQEFSSWIASNRA